MALSEESRDGFVTDLSALVEVDLEDVGAVLGKGQDGAIAELIAVVELELLMGWLAVSPGCHRCWGFAHVGDKGGFTHSLDEPAAFG